MQPRRDWVFSEVRRKFHRFVDDEGRWLSPPAFNANADPRVYVQVAVAYILGSEKDRQLAERLLLSDGVTDRMMRPDRCAFTVQFVIVMLLLVGDKLTAATRKRLMEQAEDNLIYYASQDLRHKGGNDNHVTLASGALILGGEMFGNKRTVEEGRANLYNFRDTFMRRGFMHETNDCYIPVTLLPLAAIAEWSRDAEIRELSLNCEARVWGDWIGHWHVNLARKPGPSARDYTHARLHVLTWNAALWSIFGDDFGQPAYPARDAFAEELPPDHFFAYSGSPSDGSWDLGFLAWMAAHTYHVPEHIGALIYKRSYPHIICGTHEVGHASATLPRKVQGEKGEELRKEFAPEIPYSAREIFTYQYQEEDWAMGTASQRMIGPCHNNNWGIYYRKAAPLQKTSDQGLIFSSFTINEKDVDGFRSFSLAPDTVEVKEGIDHWIDNGRYAGLQHERTSMMLYRPRIRDRHCLESLATSIVFPLCFKNRIARMEFGDTVVNDFNHESATLDDLFIQDGPLYIGIRPLIPVMQSASPRVRIERSELWGMVHFYSYRGPAVSVEETDMCRVGGGFLCEVATQKEFSSLDAFKTWFRKGEILDEQYNFTRHVRYHREGLDLAMRWDVLNDNIMYRTLNGRIYPTPMYSCPAIPAETLPWMTGDVSELDHFRWVVMQSKRHTNPSWPDYPLNWNPAQPKA